MWQLWWDFREVAVHSADGNRSPHHYTHIQTHIGLWAGVCGPHLPGLWTPLFVVWEGRQSVIDPVTTGYVFKWGLDWILVSFLKINLLEFYILLGLWLFHLCCHFKNCQCFYGKHSIVDFQGNYKHGCLAKIWYLHHATHELFCTISFKPFWPQVFGTIEVVIFLFPFSFNLWYKRKFLKFEDLFQHLPI